LSSSIGFSSSSSLIRQRNPRIVVRVHPYNTTHFQSQIPPQFLLNNVLDRVVEKNDNLFSLLNNIKPKQFVSLQDLSTHSKKSKRKSTKTKKSKKSKRKSTKTKKSKRKSSTTRKSITRKSSTTKKPPTTKKPSTTKKSTSKK
jgi:hypothetical protein